MDYILPFCLGRNIIAQMKVLYLSACFLVFNMQNNFEWGEEERKNKKTVIFS
jgi:hypothetical protein